MKTAAVNWVVVLSRNGKHLGSFPLAQGVNTAGRDPENHIPLPHSSVSRRHVELVADALGVGVKDLDSRNGIRVNGVPRRSARLQTGDRVSVCEFELELSTAASLQSLATDAPLTLESVLATEQTLGDRIRLPKSGSERQLATLYHVCFWVAEGLEEPSLNSRCLSLLLEALQAEEAQLYASDLSLLASASQSGEKPSIKLAGFLGKQFQSCQEATAIPGVDVGKRQRGAGDYNYLVCPLRTPHQPEELWPFVVVLRHESNSDFSPDDRVLVQAICQLWTRGQVRTKQVQALRRENEDLRMRVNSGDMAGSSPALEKLREKALKAAATHATVLILGETGSGKELLAQFLHDNSPRRTGPMVKVNCAAIPESLIESELFGYSKGAFSGAIRDHRGKFVQADGGTLFLDEIGEMPMTVQAKVLRALENREAQPLGSEATQTLDIRIIAATHCDLHEAVRNKQFREDLLYRLDVQTLRVPPLRERREDIEALAEMFLKKFCAANGLADIRFSPEALDILRAHAWPGNIRELSNVTQRCALNASGLVISPEEVLEHARLSGASTGAKQR